MTTQKPQLAKRIVDYVDHTNRFGLARDLGVQHSALVSLREDVSAVNVTDVYVRRLTMTVFIVATALAIVVGAICPFFEALIAWLDSYALDGLSGKGCVHASM